MDANFEPFRKALKLLNTVPGIGHLSAEAIVAEIGIDMSRFPSDGHLISWAGLCPGNHESAGKRRSTRMRQGAPWLKTALVQCAWAATRVNGTYLQAQFLRLRSRRGAKKAICAVAASILTAIYHMLKNGTSYAYLAASHFDRRTQDRKIKHMVHRLKNLGYSVELTQLTA